MNGRWFGERGVVGSSFLTSVTVSQFQDIRQFQDLSVIVFGGTVISDATNVDGNTGSTWNYGQNFGGGTNSPTVHSGGVGMYGSWGTNETYPISLCPGTAGSVCAG